MARESKRTRDERRFGKPARLIDMALSNQWKLPGWVKLSDTSTVDVAAEWRKEVLRELEDCTVVVADNACNFLYAESPKEEWDIGTDFPCCAPPRPRMFVEMKRPPRILSEGVIVSSSHLPFAWGWLLSFTDKDELIKKWKNGNKTQEAEALKKRIEILMKDLDMNKMGAFIKGGAKQEEMYGLSAKEQGAAFMIMQYISLTREDAMDHIPEDLGWSVEADLILGHESGAVTMPATISTTISKSGTIMSRPKTALLGGESLGEGGKDATDFFCTLAYPMWLALSFMHCKNVTLQSNQPDRSLNNERRKAGLKPFVRYHTINIEPMKRALKTEGNSEVDGLKRALHICRGHFSTYSEEKPLFGRIAGTFWIPSHVRGSIKEGVVVSDYNVKV